MEGARMRTGEVNGPRLPSNVRQTKSQHVSKDMRVEIALVRSDRRVSIQLQTAR